MTIKIIVISLYALMIIIVIFVIPILTVTLVVLTNPLAIVLTILPLSERVAAGISSLLALLIGVGGTYVIIKKMWPKKQTLEPSKGEEGKKIKSE